MANAIKSPEGLKSSAFLMEIKENSPPGSPLGGPQAKVMAASPPSLRKACNYQGLL